MREGGTTVDRTQFSGTTDGVPTFDIPPKPLDRALRAAEPKQKRAGDTSHIRTRERWQYPAVILDPPSRRVIGPASATARGGTRRSGRCRWLPSGAAEGLHFPKVGDTRQPKAIHITSGSGEQLGRGIHLVTSPWQRGYMSRPASTTCRIRNCRPAMRESSAAGRRRSGSARATIWEATPIGRRGRQQTSTDAAIQTCPRQRDCATGLALSRSKIGSGRTLARPSKRHQKRQGRVDPAAG